MEIQNKFNKIIKVFGVIMLSSIIISMLVIKILNNNFNFNSDILVYISFGIGGLGIFLRYLRQFLINQE